MAGEEPPVFHDFFGIVGAATEDGKQPPHTTAVDSPKDWGKNLISIEDVDEQEVCTHGSSQNSQFEESSAAPVILPGPFSSAFQTSDDLASEHSLRQKGIESQHLGEKFTYRDRQGKRIEICDSGDSSHEQLQMDTDALDSSRLLKMSRLERLDDRKRGHHEVAVDDLHLTMQPPRTVKMDVPTFMSQKWDSSQPASLSTGMFGPSRTGQKNLHADKIVANSFRESAITPQLHISPADEGSRTGLKGSSVGNLLNRGSGNVATGSIGPGLPLGRSKSWSQNAGTTEPTFVASQQATPITRQLTIFYGGQAHVFEDVSSDKAEAIMTLAGSSGRSWSTVYSPRPKSSIPLSVSEGSMSTYEREREKSRSKPSSMNGFDNSLAMSTEIHNALTNSVHTEHGGSRTGHSRVPEQFTKWSTDMQIIADRIGKKPEERMQVSISASEADKELF